MTVAIEVADVSKKFRKSSEPAKTFKERMLTLRRSTVADFHALRNVDFEVEMGQTFGILGHNGSGKSTLLKCVAGTIRPTSGIVRVRGRLSALLELGAGFHPDLTGRENIFLNGSILGFSKARIEEIFDDIVEFAGLEEFIDTQVKHYSSGMYARLGFAVAVNLEPDVLLIDEVLAVGDEAFQRKCIERVRGFQADGRTICLVTHAPEMVRFLCDRAMVLDHGRMIHLGDVNDAVAEYRRSLSEQGHDVPHDEEGEEAPEDGRIGTAAPSFPVRFTEVEVSSPPAGRPAFQPGDEVAITARFNTVEGKTIRARMAIIDQDGVQMVNVSTFDITGADLRSPGPTGSVTFKIKNLPLMDGHYHVTLVLMEPLETAEFDRVEERLTFDVYTGGAVHGKVVIDLDVESDSLRPGSA